MSCLAGQKSETHDSQVASFALGVSAPGQLARRYCGDVRVEVCRVECENIRRKLEPGNSRLRNRHLRLLQCFLSDLLRHTMKSLPTNAEPGKHDIRGTLASRKSPRSRLCPGEQAR
jgi:hypothetical protein